MSVDWSKAPEGATAWDCRQHADKTWMRPNWRPNRGWDYWAGKHWIYYGEMPKEQERQMIHRPPQQSWTGEGLPPVGTELECGFYCEDFKIWHAGVCVAVGEDPEGREEYCVVKCGNKMAMYTVEGRRMRPIRTAEQIAADERELAITDICVVMDKDPSRPILREKAGVLYDAGYRKQVAA